MAYHERVNDSVQRVPVFAGRVTGLDRVGGEVPGNATFYVFTGIDEPNVIDSGNFQEFPFAYTHTRYFASYKTDRSKRGDPTSTLPDYIVDVDSILRGYQTEDQERERQGKPKIERHIFAHSYGTLPWVYYLRTGIIALAQEYQAKKEAGLSEVDIQRDMAEGTFQCFTSAGGKASAFRLLLETTKSIHLSAPAPSSAFFNKIPKFVGEFIREHASGENPEVLKKLAVQKLCDLLVRRIKNGTPAKNVQEYLGRLADLARMERFYEDDLPPGIETILQDENFVSLVRSYLPQINVYLDSHDSLLSHRRQKSFFEPFSRVIQVFSTNKSKKPHHPHTAPDIKRIMDETILLNRRFSSETNPEAVDSRPRKEIGTEALIGNLVIIHLGESTPFDETTMMMVPTEHHYGNILFDWDNQVGAAILARLADHPRIIAAAANCHISGLRTVDQMTGATPNMIFLDMYDRELSSGNLGTSLERNTFNLPGDANDRSRYTQPPLFAETAEIIAAAIDRSGAGNSTEFLQSNYEQLRLIYNYFTDKKYLMGGEGLVQVNHPHALGTDSNPAYFRSKVNLLPDWLKQWTHTHITNKNWNAPSFKKMIPALIGLDYYSSLNINRVHQGLGWDLKATLQVFNIEDVMMNCIVVSNLRHMAAIADKLEKSDDREQYLQQAKELEGNILTKLWKPGINNQKQGFYSRVQNEDTDELTIGSLFPVLLETISREQLGSILDLMADDTRFNADFPYPSVDKASPHYDGQYLIEDRLWIGPTWAMTNGMLQEGLLLQMARFHER